MGVGAGADADADGVVDGIGRAGGAVFGAGVCFGVVDGEDEEDAEEEGTEWLGTLGRFCSLMVSQHCGRVGCGTLRYISILTSATDFLSICLSAAKLTYVGSRFVIEPRAGCHFITNIGKPH